MAKMFLFSFFTLAMVMSSALAITINPLTNKENDDSIPYANTNTFSLSESIKGLNYRSRGTATCDRFPRVCRAKGSEGPDCCKKKCVNVMSDDLNCGECGRRCRFGQRCCNGYCANVMYDERNCGACKNKCKKGSFCKYGMCSYA